MALCLHAWAELEAASHCKTYMPLTLELNLQVLPDPLFKDAATMIAPRLDHEVAYQIGYRDRDVVSTAWMEACLAKRVLQPLRPADFIHMGAATRGQPRWTRHGDLCAPCSCPTCCCLSCLAKRALQPCDPSTSSTSALPHEASLAGQTR